MFKPLPQVPDHPALERAILERWEREETFRHLREQNAGGPPFGFMDGPITANAPAGVHHGIGRTLKDVFQRYKALRGFDLRYQNGFDSQGLHVEVQVEKALGLNSKREIGLAEVVSPDPSRRPSRRRCPTASTSSRWWSRRAARSPTGSRRVAGASR